MKRRTAVGLDMAAPVNPALVPVVTAKVEDPPPPAPQALPVTVNSPPALVWTHWPDAKLETVMLPTMAPYVTPSPDAPRTLALDAKMVAPYTYRPSVGTGPVDTVAPAEPIAIFPFTKKVVPFCKATPLAAGPTPATPPGPNPN